MFQEVYNGTISQKCVNVSGFGRIIFQHAIVPWRALDQVVFGKLNFIVRPTSKQCLFPVRDRVIFLSKWADRHIFLKNFFSEEWFLHFLFSEYDFLLSFELGYFNYFFSLLQICNSNKVQINIIYQVIDHVFRFHFVCCKDSLCTTEIAIEMGSHLHLLLS